MTQHPHGGDGAGHGPSGPQLPNFQGDSGPTRPPSDLHQAHDPAPGPAPSHPRDSNPPRNIVTMLTVGTLGTAAVLLVVVALVLSLTVFRPSEDPLADREHTPEVEASERDPGGGEYIPDGEEEGPSEPAPEVTHIEAPTQACEFLPHDPQTPQSSGTRTSGDLSFTIPEGWSTDVDWGGTLPHATDVAFAEKHIELNYYSVAQIGQVDWSGADGGYPGAEDAAAAYVQCHLTRADGVQAYGENPEVSSYVSEAVEVDGQEGWMVRGVVEVAEDGVISTYTSVEIVAVVVETPSGPTVFKVATSADDPAMAADLESMIDSLAVA